MKIVDVSEKNTSVDFEELSEMGIQGVYLCASHGTKKDKTFEERYEQANNAGLQVGAYHVWESPKNPPFTVDSCKEGRTFGKAVNGKDLDLPLAVALGDYKIDECADFDNGINAFTQNLDKTSGMLPTRNTKRLIVRGTAEQLEFLDKDADVRKYPKWVCGSKHYNKAVMAQINTLGGIEVHES